MSWGNGAPRGWPGAGGSGDNVLSDQQPQWIVAGAWSPLDSNTYKLPVDQEFVSAGDIVYNTLRYDLASTDEWFFTAVPPVNWTSGKITFIPHYLVVDALGTPASMILELGIDAMPDEFDPDVDTTWQTITSTKTSGSSTVPQYVIGTESAELTITGGLSSSALGLRLKRGSDVESDPLYFVGLFLKYV